MATQPRENLDFEEQRVRILRAIEEVEKFAAESRKLNAEQLKLGTEQAKLDAEQRKLLAEQSKIALDARFSPWMLLAQGVIAGAALVGAGAALAKLFLS